MTYLILGIAAVYLFKVNPVLCVVVVGVVAFFKIRGIFGGRRGRARVGASPATEAALVAMCLTLLERSERQERDRAVKSGNRDEDPLGGLFLE